MFTAVLLCYSTALQSTVDSVTVCAVGKVVPSMVLTLGMDIVVLRLQLRLCCLVSYCLHSAHCVIIRDACFIRRRCRVQQPQLLEDSS
jgi:hypothetical protein